MQKLKVIVGIGMLILIAGAAWMFFAGRNVDNEAPAVQNEEVEGETTSQKPITEEIRAAFPKGETIMIGTPSGSVQVKNFYNDATEVDEEYIIVRKTKAYTITYSTFDSSFAIGISETSDASRAAGEEAFLEVLGIGRQEACKLDVSIQTNVHIGRLSFCGQGL